MYVEVDDDIVRAAVLQLISQTAHSDGRQRSPWPLAARSTIDQYDTMQALSHSSYHHTSTELLIDKAARSNSGASGTHVSV